MARAGRGRGRVFGIVNTVVKPVLVILSPPAAVATLGLFLVVKVAMRALTNGVVSDFDVGTILKPPPSP